MNRPVVPVRSMAMRLPDAGRIRIGTSEKATSQRGKEFDRPVKLDRFRFTSSDPKALQEVADLYGGAVVPWKHAKAAAGQYEVITDAREIRIALPNDPLGNTPIYEMWEGGGCQRRCDGEQCDLMVQGADGVELQQVPCLCAAKRALECKVTTRLSVILPEIRFVGVWRLDTHGWNAAQELPGMVDLIRGLQDKGIIRGLLRVEARTQVSGGKTKEFMVPVLGLDESVEALASGRAQVGVALGAPALGEIGSGGAVAPVPAGTDGLGGNGSAHPDPAPSDDDVIDAELVDDERTLADVLPEGANLNRALVLARQLAPDLGIEPPTSLEQVTDYRLQARVLDGIGALA